jgi:hypothetical protein
MTSSLAMDPENPVVKLCAAGMQAEFAGQLDDAQRLFLQAWGAAGDDYEACIAAHFVARHQPEPGERLRWNLVALARAEAAGDERVRGFFASLYLNLGYASEETGDLAAARHYYVLAGVHVDDLPDSPYAEVVKGGLAAGLARLAAGEGQQR